MKKDENECALSRVFEVAGCHTQVELAEFLSIRQSSISDAKRRNSIPAEWLLKLLRYKRINPDWILTGQGPRLLHPIDCIEPMEPLTVHVLDIRPPEMCSVEELMTELVRRLSKNIH